MKIQDNPFTSDSFIEAWTAHFNPEGVTHAISAMEGVRFFKHAYLPLYISVGHNHTKGITYELNPGAVVDLADTAALVYDVPDYFESPSRPAPPGLGCHRVRQYPGYLIDLSGFTGLDEFLGRQFSKSSRYKLRKYKKRLEQSFDIRYVMHTGEMGSEEYEQLFETFRGLLVKRFQEKQTTNNNLDVREWSFYREVAYPLLLQGKAGLFVIYAGEAPIGVTLLYFSRRIAFDAITVFDTDYGKFHPGSVTIMALIEWCLANKMEVLDFSKGYFDYKEQWATRKYDFEYHIYYDRASRKSALTAQGLASFYRLKQSLRERRVNEKLHALAFRLKGRTGPGQVQKLPFSLEEVPPDSPTGSLVPPGSEEFGALLAPLCEHLYLSGDHIRDLSVYRDPDTRDRYLFKGPGTLKGVRLNR